MLVKIFLRTLTTGPGCHFRVYTFPNLKTVKKALKARRCLSKLPNVLISGIGMLN